MPEYGAAGTFGGRRAMQAPGGASSICLTDGSSRSQAVPAYNSNYQSNQQPNGHNNQAWNGSGIAHKQPPGGKSSLSLAWGSSAATTPAAPASGGATNSQSYGYGVSSVQQAMPAAPYTPASPYGNTYDQAGSTYNNYNHNDLANQLQVPAPLRRPPSAGLSGDPTYQFLCPMCSGRRAIPNSYNSYSYANGASSILDTPNGYTTQTSYPSQQSFSQPAYPAISPYGQAGGLYSTGGYDSPFAPSVPSPKTISTTNSNASAYSNFSTDTPMSSISTYGSGPFAASSNSSYSASTANYTNAYSPSQPASYGVSSPQTVGTQSTNFAANRGLSIDTSYATNTAGYGGSIYAQAGIPVPASPSSVVANAAWSPGRKGQFAGKTALQPPGGKTSINLFG